MVIVSVECERPNRKWVESLCDLKGGGVGHIYIYIYIPELGGALLGGAAPAIRIFC